MREWYDHVHATAKKHGLDPCLCLALAAGESGKGKEEVRFTWVGGGRWHGPYNIHRRALAKWDITDWRTNTEVGIASLAKHIHERGSLRAALRKYNTGDSPAQFNRYYNNIMRLWRLYEKRRLYDPPKIHEPPMRNFALRMEK